MVLYLTWILLGASYIDWFSSRHVIKEIEGQ